MKVEVTDEELAYLYELAKARHDAKHKSFRNANQIMPKHKGEQFQALHNIDKQYLPHFLGLVGEFAWAKHTDSEIDTNIYAVRDPGEDFPGIEVRTITYCGPGEPELKVKCAEYEAKTPKKYVLARFNLKTRELELLGFITRKTFDKHKVKKKYGRFLPNNYIVPLSKMRKIA